MTLMPLTLSCSKNLIMIEDIILILIGIATIYSLLNGVALAHRSHDFGYQTGF